MAAISVFGRSRSIPPDLMQLDMPDSPASDSHIASLQDEEDQHLQKKREEKIKKSLVNYQAIQDILQAELLAEKDQDIQAAIQKQLEILDAIVSYKRLGNKASRTEIQNQSQTQSQTQSQNQAKTYSQAVKLGLAEKREETINQKLSKNQQKQKKTLEYREKRLVIQVTEQEANMLNSYSLRNQINDRFFQKENINKPVVATVTKSLSGQSIILTTMSDFSADYMIQNKSIWQDLVACKKVEKDIH